MKKFILSISLSIFALMANSAKAIKLRLDGLDTTATEAGFVKRTITEITGSAIGLILSAIGILFLGLMIYGGFIWMTAQGNMSDVDKARKLIVAAIVGLIIVLSAFVVTAYLGDTLSSTVIQ